MHAIDADIPADLVEVDIAGLDNGVMQVDFAVPLRPPVTVAVRTSG